MEKYILLLVATVNSYVCYRFITDNVWAKQYIKNSPKAWFIVPIGVIEKTIDLIIKGEIINYSYDRVQKIIVRKY